MNTKQAKQHYINRHFLGNLTISQLYKKAEAENISVYGDKAQILQCFDQSRQMTKLFRLNKGD